MKMKKYIKYYFKLEEKLIFLIKKTFIKSIFSKLKLTQ